MTKSVLDTFYQNWHKYQRLLIRALAPLSLEQLALKTVPQQRSIGVIVTHMVGARSRWFYKYMGEGDQEIAEMAVWDRSDQQRSAAELIYGLETTWKLIESSLERWTPEDMAYTFETVRDDGETYALTRQWVIWHLIEHDLHHGGEVSLTLGSHGLTAPDI